MACRFVATDHMCKFWPYIEREHAELTTHTKPLLSVLHAKFHDWACQVWYKYFSSKVVMMTSETSAAYDHSVEKDLKIDLFSYFLEYRTGINLSGFLQINGT